MSLKRKPAGQPKPKLDPGAYTTLTAFKVAAKRHTVETTKSQAKAVEALKKQGLLTPTGKLSKKYAKQA